MPRRPCELLDRARGSAQRRQEGGAKLRTQLPFEHAHHLAFDGADGAVLQHLRRPPLRVGIKWLDALWPYSVALVWDDFRVEIVSTMHDLEERSEMGVLGFRVSPAGNDTEDFAFPPCGGHFTCCKLIAQLDQFSAESGLLFQCGEQPLLCVDWRNAT